MLYQVEHLKFSYQWNNQEQQVLRDINLKIAPSSFSCIVGPSGTGKTTLLNILGLIEEPKGGKVFFEGQDVSKFSENEREKIRLKNVGFVFQSFFLIPTLTVIENTIYFLRILGKSDEEARQIGLETLDLLGIKNQAEKLPMELSGGQRQRVAIARALAKKPQVVLADEPTANLDSETAIRIVEAFQVMQKTEKVSFIFSTHDTNLMKFANQVFHIKDGMIEEVRT